MSSLEIGACTYRTISAPAISADSEGSSAPQENSSHTLLSRGGNNSLKTNTNPECNNRRNNLNKQEIPLDITLLILKSIVPKT